MDHLDTSEPEQRTVTPAFEDAVLIGRLRGALDTEERGDALVEVARNANRAERTLARLTRELEEVRNGLEEDFDITENGGPNKAMRLANMIDEALYGPGGY